MLKQILWDKPKVEVFIDLAGRDLTSGSIINISASEIAKLDKHFIFKIKDGDIINTYTEYHIDNEDGLKIIIDLLDFENSHYVITGNTLTYDSGDGYFMDTDKTLSIENLPADAKATGDAIKAVEDEIDDVKTDLNYQTEIHTIIDRPSLRGKNNSAITDNGDGTYTVGTTDYGNATFYPTYKLPKGKYLLYGVPNGYSWLSTSTSHADAVATNNTNTAKVITIADDTASYTLGYRINARPSESFVVAPFLKRIVSLPDYVINSFDTSKIVWEYGYYYGDGTAGINDKSVRSQTGLFIQVCKGSTIALKNYSDGERLRFCIYANPSEEHFKERITLGNQVGYVFTEDCYIRIYMYYNDDRAISDISALTSKAVINILQYVRTTDEGEDIILPTAWSEKIQTIQEAQGKNFTFAIQTDTHYDGYGNVEGENLKLLTNYIGFDFVANLGDVIRGYADENIDSDVNMRSAMTEIMHRYITGISCPFMVAMGNHDMNPMWASAFGGEKFSNDEIWGRMFRPSFNTNLKATTQTGMMYYYTDFDDIRVIVLNTQDGTDQGFGIGAVQLDWFTTDALDTQKQVIVLSHVPLVDGWSVGSNYVSSYADIVSALQAYKTNGGKVIGCFSGHTHTQENKTVDGILYVTFRNGGNYGEVVMIDLENETIDTITVGFSGNRSFTF